MASYSGFWGGTDQYSLLNGKSPRRSGVSVAFGARGLRSLRAVILQLVDGDVGGTASATYKRIKASENDGAIGGTRTVETVTIVNRATTSDDQDDIASVLVRDIAVHTRDLSGNGARS